MATGWPMKTTYANGDVFSSNDVNDITGTINLLGQSVTTSAGKNAIINGGMDIWQRGTSFTTTGVYTADRWFTGTNSGQTLSRQTTSDTTNLPTIQYCLRAQRNSGTSNTNIVGIAQSIETSNSIRFAGQAATLSFYARKGANLSGTVTATLYSGTGTDQRRDFGAGFTGEATVVTSNPSLTTSWVRYTISGTVAATATELAALIYFIPVGTAGAADYIEVTGVQLEIGTATTFSRAGGTIQGELAACQRYYEKSILQTSTPGANGNVGEMWFPNGTIANGETWQLVRFAVTKRTSPTVTTYSYNGTSGRAANDSGTDYGADSANVWRNGDAYAVIKNNSGSSMTVTSVRWVYCNWTASAEL